MKKIESPQKCGYTFDSFVLATEQGRAAMRNNFKRSSSCPRVFCVEVSFKNAGACGIGACVQVAAQKDEVIVRHSKNHNVVLSFSKEEWSAFVDGVKKGEFDLSRNAGE